VSPIGSYQTYRGNAEQKMFYVIDQLTGGINTEHSDDTSPDNEFYNIVNFDMDNRGTLFKRLGFGKLNAVSQILNLFESIPLNKGKTPENPFPENENDNIVYMKMLKNDNGVFRNLSAYAGDKAYRQYQHLYGMQNNSFKLMMITTNKDTSLSKAWIFTCKLPSLVYIDGEPTEAETIEITSSVINLPVIFNWNKNLLNIETLEFFDKIYFTSNNKGLVTFNRTNDTFSYSGFTQSGITNKAYKPNAMEIRKVGFNLLGTNPLYWVDYQGLTTESIQGIYLTTLDAKPVLVIPYGGKFRINILYTGADGGFTFEFKDGDKLVSATTAVNTTLSTTGLKVYDITLKEVPSSEVEIKILKTGTTLEPYYDYYMVGAVDPEAKVVGTLNVGDYGICEMYNRAVYYKGDTLWFSEINSFNYVPNYNYVSLPIEPTDKITKVVFFKNVYIVFTKYRIYKMIGQFGTTGFQIMPVNMAVGCHAPNTVVPIENELYFASPRGLYSLRSSEFRDGIENLKELDSKVKNLTSNVTLYLGEIDDPAIRYNGISEKAYAIRYKDKYMLFFNTAYEEGELAGLVNKDALVYKYEMKAFTLIKFPIKPNFLFMVDGAITTFCTIKEREDYTEEEVVFEYDFETGTSSTIPDLSDNGLNGTLIGGKLQPGLGLAFNGTTGFAKLGSIANTVPMVNGFEVEFRAKLSELIDKMTMFDLGQLVATSSAAPTSGSVFTAWSNGYRAEFRWNSTPVTGTNNSTVSWTLRWHRDNTSRNAAHSVGSFNLKEGANTLVAATAFTFNFGASALFVDVKTGSFTVNHAVDGTYTKTWTLAASSQYPTYSTGYNKGPTAYYDVRQGASWDSRYGIRMVGRAVPYDWGSRVYLTTYVSLQTYASLYCNARTMYGWINGTKKTYAAPAISSAGGQDIQCGAEQYVDVHYSGSPAIPIDAQYLIQATISSTYRAAVDVAGFNFTLPSVTAYSITTWNNFSMTGSKSIVFNQILELSKRELYMLANANGSIKIGANSEFSKSSFTVNGVMDTAENLWTVVFTKLVSSYSVSVYKNGALVGAGSLNTNSILNATRDNCMFGKSNDVTNKMFKGELYKFKLKQGATTLYDYIFENGRGTVITDISTSANHGSVQGATWLVENGLKLDGVDDYVAIPTISADYPFSNGFIIEFEAKATNLSLSKIIDMATSYNTGANSNQKSSINVEKVLNEDSISFMTTSAAFKTYKVTETEAGLLERHLWKFECHDNGVDGYDVSISRDGIQLELASFKYGGITNIERASNFIGRSNRIGDNFFKGMIYNMKVVIKKSTTLQPIFVGSIFEYDTTYDDFGRPMEVELETKGVNLKYPMHIKKLKNIFVKGLGGFAYQDFLFIVKADGALANNPYIYVSYIDDITGQIVYDYTENRELYFNEAIPLLGNLRVDQTPLSHTLYETRKLITPAKGKNFTIKIMGESSDSLSIESLGFTFKLGKVKEK
jgi:hypothetical protein